MDMNQIAVEIAYADGFDAGKQAAAEEIFAAIDKMHLHVSNIYEARAYEKLKEKYKVGKKSED